MPFRRRVSPRRFAVQRTRKMTWVRQVFNSTVVSTPPSFYTFDLLGDWKTRMGITLNLPDITIWRVLLKISVKITWPAVLASEESSGFLYAVYVDDQSEALAASNPNPITDPYKDHFMRWEFVPTTEMIAQNGVQPAANAVFYMFKNVDVKSRRKLTEIEDSLFLDVAAEGNTANIAGLAVSSLVLMSIGRR